MKIHELKTDPGLFQDVLDGMKTCEARRDDRSFEVGDELHLYETRYQANEMRDGAPLAYTGRVIARTVTHILRGRQYGLMDGWCVLSTKEL